MDVLEISRRLAEDSAEVTRSLDLFMNERMAALRAQERALEVYDAEMAEIGEGSVASSVEEPVDHNLMRHLNATRIAAMSDDYDEFESARGDLQHLMNAERRKDNKGGDKIEFDKGLEPKPEMPDASAKASMREEMFNFLDNSRMEEMKLELEYEKLREEIGLARAEPLAEDLLALQKTNHRKLLDMFKIYQPKSFGTAWGNDPDYVKMAGEMDALIRRIDQQAAAAGERALFDSNGDMVQVQVQGQVQSGSSSSNKKKTKKKKKSKQEQEHGH